MTVQYDFSDDDPDYFMTFPNGKTLRDSFEAPEALVWEWRKKRHDI